MTLRTGALPDDRRLTATTNGQVPRPGSLAAAWMVATNDLRRRRRDHTLLLTGFAAPLLLAVLIGTALGGMGSFSVRIGLVDADGSPLSQGIVESLARNLPASAPVRIERLADEGAARAGVGGGSIGAVIIVPAGFGESVTGPAALAGEPPLSLVVLGDARMPFAGEVARAVANGVAARIDTARLGTATALATATPANPPAVDPPATDTLATTPAAGPRLPELIVAAATVEPAIVAVTQPAGSAYRPIAYFGASMSVVFLFFTMGAGARSYRAEHTDGTLSRLRAAPIPERSIVLGKSFATMVVGIASLTTVWLVTSVIFRAEWGDPVAVLAIIVATVLAVGGIGSLITGLCRSVAQAEAFTSIAAFVLALLGGSFQPPGSLPDSFERLSALTPNGMAQKAFVQIGAGGAGLVDVLPTIAALLAIAAVTLTIGITLIRRRVRP